MANFIILQYNCTDIIIFLKLVKIENYIGYFQSSTNVIKDIDYMYNLGR